MFPLTSFSKMLGAALIAGWLFKEGGTYFKVKRIIHMKFENFVIFFYFFCYKNLPLFYIVLYFRELLVIFLVSLFVYFLHMSFNVYF